MGLLVINIGKIRGGGVVTFKRRGGMGNRFIGLEMWRGGGGGEWVGVHHE